MRSTTGDVHLSALTPTHLNDPVMAKFTSRLAPPPKTPEMLKRIRITNRRKRYLDTHPEYFSSSLELAGLPTSSDS